MIIIIIIMPPTARKAWEQ